MKDNTGSAFSKDAPFRKFDKSRIRKQFILAGLVLLGEFILFLAIIALVVVAACVL